MPTLGWRWLLALSSVPSFLLLVFYTITPESPRYLCSKGRKSDALLVLERMARMNRKPLPPGELISDRNWGSDELAENARGSEETHVAQVSKTETSLTKDVSSKVKCVGSLYKLLSRKLLRTTLLLWIGFFGNAFTYYGVILLTSGLSDGGCGVKKKDKVGTRLYKDVFITSLAEFPGLILSAVIVDRIGRKFTVALMLFGTFAFLIPLVSHYRELATTALLFCARICITGSITTLSIYAPEVYPTSVRSTGYGTANSVGKIGGIISPVVSVGLIDGCHQTAAVLLFAGVIIATGLGVLFFPIETKGSSLKDSVDSLVAPAPESKQAALT